MMKTFVVIPSLGSSAQIYDTELALCDEIVNGCSVVLIYPLYGGTHSGGGFAKVESILNTSSVV